MSSKKRTHIPKPADNPKAYMTKRQYKRFMGKIKPFPDTRPEHPQVLTVGACAYNIKSNPKAYMTKQEYEDFMRANPFPGNWFPSREAPQKK